jgi:hypothetical protein
MSFVPSVFSRSRKITQVDLDLSSPCGNTICVPPGHRFFMKVLIVTALSHLIGLKRSRLAHTAFGMFDIWKAALVSNIFVMGCTLWEAHAPNYGVTSLILAFRHLDAVHVLKCQHSLQNQHLEQANVNTPI